MSSQTDSPPSPDPPSSEESPPPTSGGSPAPSPPSPSPSSPPPTSNKNSSSPPPLSPPPPSKGKNNDVPPGPPPPAGGLSPPTTPLSPPPSNSSAISPHSSSGNNDSSSGSELSVSAIIGIAAGAGFLLLVMILIIAFRKQNKDSRAPPNRYYTNHDDDFSKRKKPPNLQLWNHGEVVLNMPPSPGAAAVGGGSHGVRSFGTNSSHGSGHRAAMAVGFNKSSFTLDELFMATNGFAQENLLGQGGFAHVHKGVLPNGKEIAVKRLKSSGGQGDREFQAEVDVISRVHHRHLVSLVGYCISDDRKLLVYEFVPNKTLEYHLHGKDLPVMVWGIRLKIAIGAAKGLAYLHEDCHPRIIHRDIKGANILIDNNFDAKVADFGLAKFTQDNHTHVSTRVMGTFGYLAPEYASSGKLTDKSDVFSYGVVLLELITGRPPITGQYGDHESLVEWARPLCFSASESGRYEELVDPRLENNYDKKEMARMVTCAAACVRHSAKKRPKMSQILRALEGDVSASLDDLSEGVKPGTSSVFNINATSEYDASAYSADMKRFRKLALDSGYGSSDYAIPSGSGSETGSASHSRTASNQLQTP